MNGKKIRSFRDLRIWQLGREIADEVFWLTERPAFRRDFKLAGQARESSASIPNNIAEGFERGGNREFQNFLSIAKGSCGELETQLELAVDRKYLMAEEIKQLLRKIQRTASGTGSLMRHLRKTEHRGPKFKPI